MERSAEPSKFLIYPASVAGVEGLAPGDLSRPSLALGLQ
jgi:hypothetical protein